MSASRRTNALGVPPEQARGGDGTRRVTPQRYRDAGPIGLKSRLEALFAGLPAERVAQLKAARVQERFAEAIIEEFGETAAAFVLENVQGVVVARDEAPRRASAQGNPPVYLHVYTTEAIIKSELDWRQERLKRRLRARGVYFDMLKPHSSTHDMRQRTPFARTVEDLRAKLAAEAAASADTPAKDGFWTAERIAEAVAPIAETNPDLADAIRRAMEASLLV